MQSPNKRRIAPIVLKIRQEALKSSGKPDAAWKEATPIAKTETSRSDGHPEILLDMLNSLSVRFERPLQSDFHPRCYVLSVVLSLAPGGNNMNWRMVGILVGVVLIGGAVAADVMLLWP